MPVIRRRPSGFARLQPSPIEMESIPGRGACGKSFELFELSVVNGSTPLRTTTFPWAGKFRSCRHPTAHWFTGGNPITTVPSITRMTQNRFRPALTFRPPNDFGLLVITTRFNQRSAVIAITQGCCTLRWAVIANISMRRPSAMPILCKREERSISSNTAE